MSCIRTEHHAYSNETAVSLLPVCLSNNPVHTATPHRLFKTIHVKIAFVRKMFKSLPNTLCKLHTYKNSLRPDKLTKYFFICDD